MNDFADRIECIAPMAVRSRIMNAPYVLRTGVSVRAQEVHIELPDGSRGIALVDIDAVKDSDGNIIGAVNCFQDITERKWGGRTRKNARVRGGPSCEEPAGTRAGSRATHSRRHRQRFQGGNRRTPPSAIQCAFPNRESRWTGADLHSLVMEELAPYRAAETSRADISGPALVLEPKSAQTIAIVLHELTTNAVKYGALSVPSGRLRVEWSLGETQLVIRWSEADGPPVKPPSREGFGTRVIGRVVHDLEGKFQFHWNHDGLACEIIIPLDRLAGTLSNMVAVTIYHPRTPHSV
jgi:hypothetical protein